MSEEITGLELPEAQPPYQPALPQATRKRLKFLDTRRLVAPPGHLYLNECLDRFASRQLGAQWDDLVKLRCFPFQYVSRKRAFYRYRIGGKHPYDRRNHRIIVRDTEREGFRSASKQYKKLLTELSTAIQAKHFKVLLIDPEGQTNQVASLAIFAAQVVRAFYTGTVRIRENRIKKKRWVLVDEKSFTQWLENGDGPRLQPRGSAVFKPLLPAIAERAVLNRYKLVKEPFRHLLDEVSRAVQPNIELNDVGFKAIWNDSSLTPAKKGPGPRKDVDRQAFEKDRAELKAFLIDNINKMQAAKHP